MKKIMSFLRSKGSRRFGFFISLLVFVFCARGLVAQGVSAEAAASRSLQVSLVDITSYNEFQEIQAGLSKIDGIERLSLDAEAPGLQRMSLRYTGELKVLMDKLEEIFVHKYLLGEKRLPSGLQEITISHK